MAALPCVSGLHSLRQHTPTHRLFRQQTSIHPVCTHAWNMQLTRIVADGVSDTAWYMYTAMHVYIHTYAHAYMYTCIHARIHIHMHTHIHAYIDTCTHIYTHMAKFAYTQQYDVLSHTSVRKSVHLHHLLTCVSACVAVHLTFSSRIAATIPPRYDTHTHTHTHTWAWCAVCFFCTCMYSSALNNSETRHLQ